MSKRKLLVTTVTTKQVTFALTADELIAMLQDYQVIPVVPDISVKVRTYGSGESEPDLITFQWETATNTQEETELPAPVSPPVDIRPGTRARVDQMLRSRAKAAQRELWVCPVCNAELEPKYVAAPECPVDRRHGFMEWRSR